MKTTNSGWLMFVSLLIISNIAAEMKPNQTLGLGDAMVSTGGIYEMGFFNPGKGEKNYLGIWYKKISSRTVVWVANRDVPLIDPSGFLRFTQRGILELVTSNGIIIWSANVSKLVENPIAELLDSGNMIVRESGDSDPKNYLWQSFDNPSDTLLPGMKFGKNLVSGLDWFYTSWKNPDDPSPGNFTSKIDMTGTPQLFLWHDTVEQFRSGPWNGLRFNGFPSQKQNQIYTYDFISNEKEIYYYTNSSIYTRLVVTPIGQLQRYTWLDRTGNWSLYSNSFNDNCDTYAFCGQNGKCDIDEMPMCSCMDGFKPKFAKDWERADWLNGCNRKILLDCRTDGFRKYSGLKLPDTRYAFISGSMNLDKCRVACLKNCTCMAYTNSDIRNGGSGCLMWFGELIDMRKFNENGQDIYIRLAASEIGQADQQQKVMIIVMVIVVALLPCGLATVLVVCLKKPRKQDQTRKSKNEETDVPLYDFDTISHSTNDFSDCNKIGEGGFGPVYKGILKGGQEIAVKRLSKFSTQGHVEFKNEVDYIAKLQHRNLVKLLGWCIREDDRMLIYEYMPNKSLNHFLFDKIRCSLLDWPTRFNIINGIARGLLYLHQDSRFRIIHRDLKVENVLLDNEMNPKISDFGMARSFAENQTQATTKRVVGTHGYIAPEYANRGLYSIKSDVFSFGVMVLEIVSGRRNRGFYNLDHSLDLLGHAWEYYWEGKSFELVDATVEKSSIASEVLRCVQVGLLCVQHRSQDRPNISTVIMMLGGEGAIPRPKQPAFFTGSSREIDMSSTKFSAYSPNQVSFSEQLVAR